MEEIYIVESEEEKETASNLKVASSSKQNVKNPDKKSPYAAVIVEKVDKLLPCNKCNRSFKLADSLIRHIALVHNRESCGPSLDKKYKCQKCSITFGRWEFLEGIFKKTRQIIFFIFGELFSILEVSDWLLS